MDDILNAFCKIIVWFISAYFLMFFWNSIAAAFGLPQFGYWVAFTGVYVLSALKPDVTIKKEDK